MIIVRKYVEKDIPTMTKVWNEIVREGNAFPQNKEFDEKEAQAFFNEQSYCAVAEVSEQIVGLYILHPNNVGHCGHISNASFAVSKDYRGEGIGELLVSHCLYIAPKFGFKILQFNAVLSTNISAIRLYEKFGFERIGEVKNGYAFADGSFGDIVLFYKNLDEGSSACKNCQRDCKDCKENK